MYKAQNWYHPPPPLPLGNHVTLVKSFTPEFIPPSFITLHLAPFLTAINLLTKLILQTEMFRHFLDFHILVTGLPNTLASQFRDHFILTPFVMEWLSSLTSSSHPYYPQCAWSTTSRPPFLQYRLFCLFLAAPPSRSGLVLLIVPVTCSLTSVSNPLPFFLPCTFCNAHF